MQTITSLRFLAIAVLLGVSGVAQATNLSPGSVPVPPVVEEKVPRRFEAASQQGQKLSGLLLARMQANLNGRLLRVDEAGLLDGFRKRPGVHPWIGEHVGKFLDASAKVWLNTKDPRLKKLMDRVASTLIATQQADGYLGTYVDAERWTSWDVWVHKYNILGLLAYHQATGNVPALEASKKMGDLLIATFGGGKRDLITAGTHVGMASTSVLAPMVALYRQTGDKRYLDFCQDILKAMEQPNGPKILSTLQASANVFKTANAKAYEMISNLIGLVDLYAITGETRLIEPVRAAWNDIAKRRLYITGTTSSFEHFHDDHELPAEEHHNIGETCVTVNWIELTLALMRFDGEAKYADEIERSVYNHLLGAQDAHNGNFCYYTPLNGNKRYGPGISCCVSSGPRGIAMLPELAWGVLDGAPAVTLWTAGRAQLDAKTPEGGHVAVKLQTQTRFPEDGKVTLTVQPTRPATFALALRVPAWTTRFVVTIGQGPHAVTKEGTPGSFLRLEQAWGRSTKLQIDMDLPVRLVSGAPTYPGRVAVVRGPQVLVADAPAAINGKSQGVDPALFFLDDEASLASLKPLGRGAKPSYRIDGHVMSSLRADAKQEAAELVLVPYANARRPLTWLLSRKGLPAVLSAAAKIEAERKVYRASRASTAPKIDGTLEPGLSQSNMTPIDKVLPRGNPRSQAWFSVRWDAAHLYVTALVKDPTPESREADFDSDYVAIGVDGNRLGGVAYDANDIYVAHRFDNKRVEGTNDSKVRRAATCTNDGYVVEFAVPWAQLGGKVAAGRRIGFEIRNHDQGPSGIEDDGPKQWADSDPSFARATNRFGIVELVDSP